MVHTDAIQMDSFRTDAPLAAEKLLLQNRWTDCKMLKLNLLCLFTNVTDQCSESTRKELCGTLIG
ncbi:hypothetical protein T08_15576 [Trichinella sp. T8]|nr:hypothetical protein T08_15576 [Trichinella sp. T8]